jgi:starvation-inducible DNA-binding protein
MKTIFNSKIDLSEGTRKKVVAILNQMLADITDLYTQTKQAHWNVRGQYFYSLHLLFDRLAESVDEHIDPLAERITSIGGVAMGTARMASANSTLKEFPTEKAEDLHYVAALVERYAQCAKAVRKAIGDTDDLGDKDSSDLLTAVSRDLDTALWMLEAHTRK